ncbi:hypothetical protein D3C78_1979440 [compost metagenome]
MNKAMKSLVTGGMATRSDWGRITKRRICGRLRPSASEASICPLGTAWMPAR